MISVADFEADLAEYEDDEAWKKHLPKFQRGMKCEDHVDCDRHNVSGSNHFLIKKFGKRTKYMERNDMTFLICDLCSLHECK